MSRTLLEADPSLLAEEAKSQPFDCVVVGAGSAGLTTARTLAENGKRVAILDAGPAPFLTHLTNTELRFSPDLMRSLRGQVEYSPRTQDGEPFGRNYACLGGRGLFWNGSSPRFRDHDFAGWPFSASDLREEYQWAEAEFRVSRNLGETGLAKSIISRLLASGFAAEAGPFALDLPTNVDGRLPAGIASGLGLFFRAAGNAVVAGRIRVAVGVTAERLLISGTRVRGVSMREPGGSCHEILARSVALAGGGIESIRIASLSEVPDDSGRLGCGIQDHVFHRCYFEGPEIYGKTPEPAAVYIPSASQETEQWEIQAPGRRIFTLDDGAGWAPTRGPAYHVMIRAFAATEKKNSNRIESFDGPLGSATVHFTYSDSDEQRRDDIRTKAIKVGDALRLDLIEHRMSGPGGSYHEAGGLDMGNDPNDSVTDAHGRFHSVPNLVSVDAASFPRIGATNPHLTIVAVARRKAIALARNLP